MLSHARKARPRNPAEYHRGESHSRPSTSRPKATTVMIWGNIVRRQFPLTSSAQGRRKEWESRMGNTSKMSGPDPTFFFVQNCSFASLGNETQSLVSEYCGRDTEKWTLQEKNCGEPQTETMARALRVVWGAKAHPKISGKII